MIKRLMLSSLIALGMAGMPATSDASTCKRPGVIQLAPGYNWANIYQAPQTTSKILGRLNNGSKICIHGVSGQFLKVQSGKTVGFIVRR